jgi:hypothetical protein
MNEKPIPTRPQSSSEKVLKDRFSESIADQCDHMDKLGQQLIALELAIPGLYATVLKLINGDKATLSADYALYITFACWLLALLFTLLSLVPRKWKVNRSIIRQDTSKQTEELGIEDFFYRTARYKRRLLFAACLFFFAGILNASLTVF